MENAGKLVQDIRNTKCAICRHVISVSPVIVMNNHDCFSLKCGRCENVETTAITKCTFFEKVAQHVTFPCIYQNCKELLAWGQATEHERKCPFRAFQCPVYNMSEYDDLSVCNETVAVANLHTHFTEKHPNNIQYGSLKCNVETETYDNMFLLIEGDLKFFVYIATNPMFTIVFSLQVSDKTKYNLKLDLNAVSLSFDNQNIVEYDYRKHCLECYKAKCNVKYHPNSKLYRSSTEAKELLDSLKLDLEPSLQSRSTDNKVTITLTLTDEGLSSLQRVKLVKGDKYDAVNSLLRHNLECPVCKGYMTGPIFTCLIGHSMCSACKPKLVTCPCCRGQMGEVRNFALENIAEAFEMTCPNEKFGCSFIGKVSEVRSHEVACAKGNRVQAPGN